MPKKTNKKLDIQFKFVEDKTDSFVEIVRYFSLKKTKIPDKADEISANFALKNKI